jgi:hypothetical protein
MNDASEFVIEEMPSRHRKWGRVKAAVEASGIPRYRMFELLKEGQIRSATLKRKGKQRGIRLIDLDSLDAYIEKHVVKSEVQP